MSFDHGGRTKGRVLLKWFPVGPLACNCTIIGDSLTREGVIVDPGGDAERIMGAVNELGLTIKAILHTHAHLDHILAAGEIHERTGAPVCLHKGDKFLWDSLESQCRMFGIPYSPCPDPQHWMKDDDGIFLSSGTAIHTPGHTPGSMSFWFNEYNLLVAGDTLFRQGIGRTDLPGGDFRQIEHSILEKLFRLDDDVLVITGHGEDTSIGFEKKVNPFFGAVMR